LLSYGPDPVDIFRGAATYVDRILRGARPNAFSRGSGADDGSTGYWPMPGLFGPLMMITVLALCGAVMFFIMRGMMGAHEGRSKDHTALDILKARFARGEITQTEYDERLRLLEV
jgi:uncharacterized membrane protein